MASNPRNEESVTDTGAVYMEENGRTYHGYKEGKYFLPNDAAELDRLDLQHKCYLMMIDGKLGLAPVHAPSNVMDVGTGTGIWAIEFAQQNPTSRVIGTDLTVVQPKDIPVPNCEFEVGDVEDEWVNYPLFDYVHVRLVCTCFNDHMNVMKRIYDGLAPGGWVEYQDIDMEFQQANADYEGNATQRWYQTCIKGTAIAGRDLLIPRRYKQMMIDTGFVDVQEHKVFVPIGEWMDESPRKKLGALMLRNMFEALRGPAWKVLNMTGMSGEEIEALAASVQAEATDKANHAYCWTYFVWGRKPSGNE